MGAVAKDKIICYELKLFWILLERFEKLNRRIDQFNWEKNVWKRGEDKRIILEISLDYFRGINC